jgi:type I restriction enzyme R subunit
VASDDVGSLEDQQTIPVITEQLELILDIQSEERWVDVSYRILEEVRKRLRLLVPLIERGKKGVIYSDFQDEIGSGTVVDVPGTGGAVGFNQAADAAAPLNGPTGLIPLNASGKRPTGGQGAANACK